MSLFKKRILMVVSACVLAPLSFVMWRYYHGWAEKLVRYYITCSMYEVIWCLLFFAIWPKKANVIRIPVIVFVASCSLEFLQLWQTGFLEAIRSNIICAGIIGTDFVWRQFPFYVIGSAVSVLILRRV